MIKLEFNKIKNIGVISETKSTTLEFNVIDWNKGSLKYDIRKWGKDGTIPYKGITLSKDECIQLRDIINNVDIDLYMAINNEELKVVEKVEFDKSLAYIYKIFGEYKETKTKKGLLTYTSWGTGPKFDIRTWNLDFSGCGKGITLNIRELDSFKSLLNQEFKENNNIEESTDTSDLDNDLFL